jgi:hypothetical protein
MILIGLLFIIKEPILQFVNGMQNVTILFNGISGSGKTTTIYGNDATEGIVFTSLKDFFPEGINKSYLLSIR